MSENSRQLILKFVSETWFGSPAEFFATLPAEEQSRLLQLIMEYKLEALGYYTLNQALPASEAAAFQKKYQANAVSSLKNKVALKSLYQLFEEKKIRFAPIKGADLAWRCYPSAALRSFCDWDILIHPDDCLRALEELANAGWKVLDKLNVNTPHHHFAVHEKDGFFLEPHRSFSQINGVAASELWQEIKPVQGDSMQHELSAELNIIQLVRHFSENNYLHQPQMKFLNDAAALISKSEINWHKVRKLAEKWQLPYPGDVLCVWNGFFPESVVEQIAPDAEKLAGYRKVFEMQSAVKGTAPGEWAMVRSKESKLTFARKSLKHMTPAAMSEKYNLSNWRFLLLMPGLYIWDLTVKFFRFCKYIIKPDLNMHRYQQMIDKLECRHEKK